MSEPWFISYVRSYLGRPGQNDAESYGVTVERLPKAHYRAIGVHHLTPDENRGGHHTHILLVNTRAERLRGVPVAYTWVGRHDDESAPPVVDDKPDNDPGANIPMGLRQIISLFVAGSGPSDVVEGLTTNHRDEAPGNTAGHHSFLVVYLAGENNGPAPAPGGWTQLELEGLSYELTNASNAIGNAQSMLDSKLRGVS